MSIYAMGTATSHLDFYQKLLSFIGDIGWTLRQGESGEDSGTASYKNYWCDVTSDGLAGEDTITGSISLHFNTLLDVYYCRLSASPMFDSSIPVSAPGSQPDSSGNNIYLPLHRNPIQYWFTGDKRHITGALLFNERWESFHIGLFMPYAFASQYPYPCLIAGCNTTTGDYKINTNGSAFPSSSVQSGYVWIPGGGWKPYPLTSVSGGVAAWPTNLNFIPNSALVFRVDRIIPTIDSSQIEQYAMLPFVLYSTVPQIFSGTYGELADIFYISGWGIQAGDVINSPQGEKFLVVQREKSTANDSCTALRIG